MTKPKRRALCALVAVVVTASVVRAYVRGGLDGSLSALIFLGVGALALWLLVEAHPE